MQTKNAPVAIFAYRRPNHLRQLLEALAGDQEALFSNVRIFVDGAKTWRDRRLVAETLKVAQLATGFAKCEIRQHKRNLGLARSIVSGITQVLQEWDEIIVLEDDIVPQPGFLAFMNKALQQYRAFPQVMQISATQFADPPPCDHYIRFLPITSSWGWATWRRAWEKFPQTDFEAQKVFQSSLDWDAFDLHGAYPYRRLLEDSLMGRGDTWAVRWYAACFQQGGLTLYPPVSYAINTGRDGSGHHDVGDVPKWVVPKPAQQLVWPKNICVDQALLRQISSQFRLESAKRHLLKASRGKTFLRNFLNRVFSHSSRRSGNLSKQNQNSGTIPSPPE